MQQMVESIKQEPMECAIEQPPLKKIKQEVSMPQQQLRCLSGERGKMNRYFLFFFSRSNKCGSTASFVTFATIGLTAVCSGL